MLHRGHLGEGAAVVIVVDGVGVKIVGLLDGGAVLFEIFPASGRTLAVAHAALDVGQFLVGEFLVARDEMLTPEGEIFGQFAREIEVETNGAKSVGVIADFDMAASTNGIGFGHRLGKTHIEEGEKHIGAVADVVAGTFPL